MSESEAIERLRRRCRRIEHENSLLRESEKSANDQLIAARASLEIQLERGLRRAIKNLKQVVSERNEARAALSQLKADVARFQQERERLTTCIAGERAKVETTEHVRIREFVFRFPLQY